MSTPSKVIGITLGDINGVGPEVAVAAAYTTWPTNVRIVLIGDADIIQRECRNQRCPLPTAWHPDKKRNRQQIMYWDPKVTAPLIQTPGQVCVEAAHAAYGWIRAAAKEALKGTLSAVVTAPINKEGFLQAGLKFTGHTELLAHLSKTKRFEMMLCAGNFRVVLVTRHLPLHKVSDAITRKRIIEVITTTEEALCWMGVRRQRIAVCGLNPHAGDGGAIGHEEQKIIIPALKQINKKKVTVVGPVPADTIFAQVHQGAYDAVLAMYHDQGLGPFKMVAFGSGVNVTLGLPFVRTSPDHGTAYDKAGKRKANPDSMREAVRLAIQLARRPNPWKTA